MARSTNIGELIDELMGHWCSWELYEEFYLAELAPSLVADPTKGDTKERELLGKLRPVLNDDEWRDLPKLMAEKRAGVLREVESERARRVAEEEEKKEAERVAALEREEKAREHQKQEEVRHQVKAQRDALRGDICQQLQSDFLAADSVFFQIWADRLPREAFEQEKLSFVKSWIVANTPGGKNKKKHTPDDEQAAAIASVHGHIQVVARAGSGKTTTLVSRALFLIKHCGVAPSQMLLLAFNRKAAMEIRRRLLGLLHDGAETAIVMDIDRRIRDAGERKRIDRDAVEASAVDAVAVRLNITLPHIMTFHALAYAIVHPEESLLFNGAEGEAQGLSRVFQQVIDDHLQVPAFKDRIRDLMLAHFREDWDRIVEGCYDQSKEELLRFRRSLPKESLGGEYLKSHGEKVIADFLFEHDVAYKYERNHWWSGVNYRPDFTLFKTPESGVIIEYFGLQGDADYDDMSNNKRQYWEAKEDWTLIEFGPSDIVREGVDSFRKRLKACLDVHGMQCNRLSEDEIWHRIRDRAIDRFTSSMVGFIGRCRKQSLTPTELNALIDSYSPLSNVEKMFLGLAHELYLGYLERLTATGDEDFDGLMQRAAEVVDAGQTVFERKFGSGDLAALRYVFIDEFQDFSDLFYRLLTAIRKQNTDVELFCVGDDWQAINGFAGSDLRFFEEFEQYIGESRQLHISTNYRSRSNIVSIGNVLMKGVGKPAVAHDKRPGNVLLADLDEFEPSLVEKQRHQGDIVTPAVLRVVNRALNDGLNVVMLSRRNALPWYVNYQELQGRTRRGLVRYLDLIRSFFPKELKKRITVSTAHKYKGLEKQVVILLDVVARSYPLIHPDWAFARILGDSPEKITKEERRLLYVAMTRAEQTLVILTDGHGKSPFLIELEGKQATNAIVWKKFPPVRSAATRLVVKIGNQERRGGAPTFAIKDQLKASGYQWQGKGWSAWAKSFPAKAFDLSALKGEVWATAADGIDVRVFDEDEAVAARYLIHGGRWECVVDELDAVRALDE